MFALLNVYKPVGMSSYDVIRQIKPVVSRKVKIGHAGTLDPLAEGVLIVCLGKATRLVELIQQHPKRYLAEARLGARSTTDDAEGKIEQVEVAVPPSRPDLERVVSAFIGTIQQAPPAFSAVKVDGKRAYEIARESIKPGLPTWQRQADLPARAVTIYQLEIIGYEYPHLRLRLSCSSGTYVRSLVRDIGEKLSTGAYCEKIIREAIGPFEINASVKLTDIHPDTIERFLIRPVEVIPPQSRVTITPSQACRLRRGLPVRIGESSVQIGLDGADFAGMFGAVDDSGNLLAIIRPDEGGKGVFRPVKVFMR